MSGSSLLDCTITASWFLPDEWSLASQIILTDILERKISMIAPSLWWFEILNVLKSAVRRKRIDESDIPQSSFSAQGDTKRGRRPEMQGEIRDSYSDACGKPERL